MCAECIKMSKFREIKLKIASGEFTVLQRQSRSIVSSIFYEIKDSNGETLKNLLQCKMCKNIYTSRKQSSSNLVKHLCYRKYKDLQEKQYPKLEPSPELKNKCMELVFQWIVGNCRPCNIVKDEGLYKLVEFLISIGHKLGNNLELKELVPNSSMMARKIAGLYHRQHETLKQELISNKNIGFSITCDMWNDNYLETSYIGATVHYIKAGYIANKVLGLREVGNDNSGCNIRNIIVNILKDFDCELCQKVTVVTGGGFTMNETFQHDRRIICINHLLNSVIEGAVSDTAEVNSITTTCSRLVKYLKKSDENNLLNNTLESYTSTRWNTVFYLLESVKQNWDDINQTLQEKNMTSRIADINLVDINEILGILRPFEEASKLLASESIPTIHHVYPHIRKLKTISSKMHPNESEMIQKFKKKLLFYMETVIDPNIQDLHKIALFLFPPANKLHNFTENEKRNIRDKCKEMLIAYEESSSNINIKMEFLDVDADADLDVFSDFVQSSESPDCTDVIANEIFRYERQTVLYFKQFDPLKWWETHKLEYPLLYRLCCFVLATPASSANSEKMFSKAPHLLSESIHERGTERVDQILFLHSNLDLNGDHTDQANANEDYGVQNKSYDSDSDSDNSKCSTPKIRKYSTSTPE